MVLFIEKLAQLLYQKNPTKQHHRNGYLNKAHNAPVSTEKDSVRLQNITNLEGPSQTSAVEVDPNKSTG